VLADPARTWTPADVLELVAGQPRDFAPDTQFAYSNTNYIVAGLLLEGVTGTTLAQNLQSRIVAPLYVALAEALGCSLATADQRLANAPGVRCKFDIV
jgi:CubicO group peptidase (beta-lactamase class C family)